MWFLTRISSSVEQRPQIFWDDSFTAFLALLPYIFPSIGTLPTFTTSTVEFPKLAAYFLSLFIL